MGDFANSIQRHDFEPGIEPSGLVWTVPIESESIATNPARGTGRLRARSLAVPDFADFANALSLNPTSTPSHVSFDVRWTPAAPATIIRDATFGFAGTFVPGDASIDFTVRNDGSGTIYRSDRADQHTISGGVGRERNGIFFD